MIDGDRVRRAAYNNAVWFDSVCRAHGLIGEFAPGIWLNRHRTPQFYPNAVTISDQVDSAAQMQSIGALIATKVPGQLSVKDSFSALDLAPLGFSVLFDEQWIYRPASMALPDSRSENIRWAKIDRSSDLIKWEDAWRGEAAEESTTPRSPIFMPPLLDDPDVAVLAAYRDGRIVAGVIANRTGDVVGMSNLFVPPHDARELGIGCVAALIEAFPALPIVGYEGGPALKAAQRMGFDAIGPLRIWLQGNSAVRPRRR